MPSCYPNQLAQQLSRGLPAVLLLWGEDAGAIRHAALAAVAVSGVDPSDPFAADSLTFNDLLANPSSLPDRAGTVAFGGGRRLVQLKGVSGDEPATAVRTLTEAVETLLALPLADVLVLLPVPRLLEKTSPLVKAVEAHPQGLGVRFFTDTVRDLAPWLASEIKSHQQSITPDALNLLAANLGADRELARREVEKLVLYAGNESPITEDMVRASVAGATPTDVFRLAEAVAARDAAATDRLLRHLDEQGEDLNAAFSAVLRHLNSLEAARKILAAGQPEDEALKAGGKFKAPPSVRADFLRQARTYPAKRLATLSQYALTTLATARGGVLQGQHVLSRAILALSA